MNRYRVNQQDRGVGGPRGLGTRRHQGFARRVLFGETLWQRPVLLVQPGQRGRRERVRQLRTARRPRGSVQDCGSVAGLADGGASGGASKWA